MMVTISETVSGFQPLLSTLKRPGARLEDKVDAYLSFTDRLREDTYSQFSKDVTQGAPSAVLVFVEDIQSSEAALSQAALQALGFCVHNETFTSVLSPKDTKNLLSALNTTLLKTSDKNTCTRALWCLSKQKFAPDIVGQELHSILCAVDHVLSGGKYQSVTVEHEAVSAIAKLLEQVPDVMFKHAIRWSKLVYPYLVSSAIKVREKALWGLQTGLPGIMNSREEILKSLIPDLKGLILGELKKLLGARQEEYVVEVWSLLVEILGKSLHRGSFINQLLPIIELAFKSSIPKIKCAAYVAWEKLIENFALDQAIINDPKRIKLIMQVFKVNNSKSEDVAIAKMKTWWFFINKLGKNVSSHFEQVVSPLVHYCFGIQHIDTTVAGTPANKGSLKRLGISSPVTPSLNLASGSPGGGSLYTNVKLGGAEILANILGSLPSDVVGPKYQYRINAIEHPIIPGPASFVKHGCILIRAVKECFISLSTELPQGLLYHIWNQLNVHIRNVLELGNKKEFSADIFTYYLTELREIVESRCLDIQQTLHLLQAVVGLPPKIMSSQAFHIQGTEVMEATPITFILDILFKPDFAREFITNETYMSIILTVISTGFENDSGALQFSQVYFNLLNTLSKEIIKSNTSLSENIWRLWSMGVTPLQEHILKTNEVNQGDALAHDFTYMYTALMIPLTFYPSLSQPSMKMLMKTWSDLYRTFARLSALVTNAEANICCEELTQKILEWMQNSFVREEQNFAVTVDCCSQLCQIVLECVDFSSLSSIFNMATSVVVSPVKWPKRKHKPLGNLHSFVKLLDRLMGALHEMTADTQGIMGKKNTKSTIPTTGHCLVSILTMLVTHVSSSSMIPLILGRLGGNIGALFLNSRKQSGSKVYTAQFGQKLEKLWMDICTCLQGRYSGMYDSNLLEKLSPMLEATFLHPKKAIKNQTVLLWNATFAKSAPLTYPDSLQPVLMKVKENTLLTLPGWQVESIEGAVVTETPVSQMSQAESQAPLPILPGMPSPHKVLRGSFLNKPESPLFKSPVKVKDANTPEKQSPHAKRKILTVHNMRNDEFVVIPPSPKKKMVLTEHQKEVLREKRSHPVMYNTLDKSQDTSMYTQLYDLNSQQTQATQSQLSSAETQQLYQKGVAMAMKNKADKSKGEKKEDQKIAKSKTEEPAELQTNLVTRKNTIESPTENETNKETSNEENVDVLNTEMESELSEPVESNVDLQASQEFVPLSGSPWGISKKKDSPKKVLFCDGLAKTGSQSPRSRTPTKNKMASPKSKTPPRPSQSSPSMQRSRSANSKSPVRSTPPKKTLDKWLTRSPRKVQTENLTSASVSSSSPITLDKWITKSPRKQSPEIMSAPVTLVEETQSPTKFQEKKPQNIDSENHVAVVQESPPKCMQTVDQESDGESVNSTSTNGPTDPLTPNTKMSIQKLASSPVIKLRKLSQEEILKYSPQKTDVNVHKPVKRRGRPPKMGKIVKDKQPVVTETNMGPSAEVDSSQSGQVKDDSQILSSSDHTEQSLAISKDNPPVLEKFGTNDLTGVEDLDCDDMPVLSNNSETMETDELPLDENTGSLFSEESQNTVTQNSESNSQTADPKCQANSQSSQESYDPQLVSTLLTKSQQAQQTAERQMKQKRRSKRRRVDNSEDVSGCTADSVCESQTQESSGSILQSRKSSDVDESMNQAQVESMTCPTLDESENICSKKEMVSEENKEDGQKTKDVEGEEKIDEEYTDSSPKEEIQENMMTETTINKTENKNVNKKGGARKKKGQKKGVEKTEEVTSDQQQTSVTGSSVKEVREDISSAKEEERTESSEQGDTSELNDEYIDKKGNEKNKNTNKMKTNFDKLERTQEQTPDVKSPEAAPARKSVNKLKKSKANKKVKLPSKPTKLDEVFEPEGVTKNGLVGSDTDDDLPLNALSIKLQLSKQPEIDENEGEITDKQMDGDSEHLNDDLDQMSCQDMFSTTPDSVSETSPMDRLKGKTSKGKNGKSNLSSQLKIDMKSPKRLRSSKISLRTLSQNRSAEGKRKKLTPVRRIARERRTDKKDRLTSIKAKEADNKPDSELNDSVNSFEQTEKDLDQEKHEVSLDGSVKDIDRIGIESFDTKSTDVNGDPQNNVIAHVESPNKAEMTVPELIETPRSAKRFTSSRSVMMLLKSQRLTNSEPSKLHTSKLSPFTKRKNRIGLYKGQEIKSKIKTDRMEELNRSLQSAFREPTSKRQLGSTKKSVLVPVTSKDGESVRTGSPIMTGSGSPSSSFHPIQVCHIYSPSASPSAGILKKRKLCSEYPVDSPSPPNKQRRVSFAEPIEAPRFDSQSSPSVISCSSPSTVKEVSTLVSQDAFTQNSPVATSSPTESPTKPVNRCLDLPKTQLPPSPLVTTTPSKVFASQSKFITTPSRPITQPCQSSPSDAKTQPFQTTAKDVSPSATQNTGNYITQTPSNSYHSTQQSEVDCVGPVFPDLVDCDTPVTVILPKLTSAMWSRGLIQLAKARNINTVGDLCKLTEYDITCWPIMTPKLQTLRNVLEKFKQEEMSRKERNTCVVNGEFGASAEAEKKQAGPSDVLKEPTSPQKELPNMEEEMEKMIESSKEQDLDSSLEALLECSEVMLDEMKALSPDAPKEILTQFTNKGHNAEVSQSEPQSLTQSETQFDSTSIVNADKVSQDGPKSPQREVAAASIRTVQDTAKAMLNPSCLSQTEQQKSDLVSQLAHLNETLTPDVLSSLPSEQIFAAHQHLTNLMMNVVQALRPKCQSETTEKK